MEEDLTGFNPPRRFHQHHNGTGRDRLAAAALSHHAECFPGFNGEIDPIHCPGHTIFSMKIDPEAFDL